MNGKAPSRHHVNWHRSLSRVGERIAAAPAYRASGRITRATGLILEAAGLNATLGSSCHIELPRGQAGVVEAEVVGFADAKVFLMPLENFAGLTPGARVFSLEDGSEPGARRVPLGDALLGRVVDGNGRPLDEGAPLTDTVHGHLTAPVLNPLGRAPIDTQIDVGVRAINALLSVGRGQRLGLFAGSGVGKSVLLGEMARHTSADVVVVGLIGERGREVVDFIHNILTEEGRGRSVVVAAPANTSPLQRLQGAAYATRIAEDFRDRGRSVLLIMDSLTRYAMAQREIALAVGEPPATRGYPPSVFARLPGLVERAGNGEPGGGSITAFYTVLTEGDDLQDPIADAARAILDGHVVLSRELAEAGHYPAIDIEASISRAMNDIVDASQQQLAQEFKRLYSRYQRNADLINIGAYTAGHDPVLDRAVELHPKMTALLQQGIGENAAIGDSHDALAALLGAPQ